MRARTERDTVYTRSCFNFGCYRSNLSAKFTVLIWNIMYSCFFHLQVVVRISWRSLTSFLIGFVFIERYGDIALSALVKIIFGFWGINVRTACVASMSFSSREFLGIWLLRLLMMGVVLLRMVVRCTFHVRYIFHVNTNGLLNNYANINFFK